MRKLLPLLPKPSRYTGIEENAVHKDIQSMDLHCALAFPDTYEIGMSYLGQKILYEIVNSNDNWYAERVMAPCLEAGKILLEQKQELATLESKTPLKNLHLLGFSITHELCYTNILYMLDLANIPLYSAERINTDDSLSTYPIVIAGGGATLSAEPMAPFMDLMLIGEGEELLPELLELLVHALKLKWSRTHFLQEARHISGVYVPSLFTPHDPQNNSQGYLVPLYEDYTSIKKRIVTSLDKAAYPVKQVVPIGAVHNRLSLEIARGCTRGCRFCHAGMIYRPVRERSLDNIENLLTNCLAETGFDDISFLSLSTGDFSALKTLFNATIDSCAKKQISVSLPSLRVGSIDDSIMQRMASIRRTGATLAPEAGSQRLRDVINKGISEEDLLLHVQKLIEHGWQQVKLYFMIGLPTETQADIDAIIDLALKVRDAGGKGVQKLQVTIAISPFVPKPFTPFQWEAQISLDEISQKVYYLRNSIKKLKCLKMRWHEPAMSYLEGILSRGDRKLAAVVESAYRKGAIFCSWNDQFKLEPWIEAMTEANLDPQKYIGTRDLDAKLAWDHLDIGIEPLFLLKERKLAFEEKVTLDCRYNACRQCGVCDTKEKASLLKYNENDRYLPQLNFAQRDQEAHLPQKDEHGRIVTPIKSASPPKIAVELTVKAAEYRIWHTKLGECAFLSQLELQAILERALRKADLPLTFSQGFRPLPLISFGRALPVGVASQAEWFAVTLHQALDVSEVQEKLSPHLLKGLSINNVLLVNKNERTLQAIQEKFQVIHTGTANEQKDFIDQWEKFAQLKDFTLVHQGKKKERILNLCEIIGNVQIISECKISFMANWENSYLSPLALVLAICHKNQLTNLDITKTEQIFNS